MSIVIDPRGFIYYVESMADVFFEKAKKYLKVGGILAVVFSILISIFLY